MKIENVSFRNNLMEFDCAQTQFTSNIQHSIAYCSKYTYSEYKRKKGIYRMTTDNGDNFPLSDSLYIFTTNSRCERCATNLNPNGNLFAVNYFWSQQLSLFLLDLSEEDLWLMHVIQEIDINLLPMPLLLRPGTFMHRIRELVAQLSHLCRLYG